ncbi:MAG: rRNA cytosine-C5-methyltransferase, partial [Paludibacteraceae bacterium]|nr:rRNA cytosine-C5-methyltransferase [Paludibacteraceae bacterium]
MKLPDDFIADLHEYLPAEHQQLIDALATEPVSSIRLNRRKIDIECSLEKVKWCEDGYYLNDRPTFTMDPLFHAGAYYVQEA